MLQLLGEITSRNKSVNSKKHAKVRKENGKNRVKSPDKSPPPSRTGDTSTSEKGNKKDLTRKPEPPNRNKGAASTKTQMSGQMSNQILKHQSEWLNNDAVPLLVLPLIEPSTMVLVATGEMGQIKLMKKSVKNYRVLPPLLSLDCAAHDMNLETCVAAQKRFVMHLSKLRCSLPTSSSAMVNQESNFSDKLQIAAHSSALQIKSARIIKVSSCI